MLNFAVIAPIWNHITTGALSALWFLFIVYCYRSAKYHAKKLKEHEEILFNSYRQQDSETKPYLSPLKHLQAEGWKASDSLSRYDMISSWRAMAQTHKQKLASSIEMMPQLGLLGTILSLLLAASFFDFDISMLGFALTTTMIGLGGALFGRIRLEMPSEESYYNIIELLENENVVKRLLSIISEQLQENNHQTKA